LIKAEVDASLLGRSVRYAIERRRADIATRRLFEANLRREANERIQRGLLPRPLLRSGDLEVATVYRPGGGGDVLGGDFYDAVELADGTLRAVIGDVCGHGPDEAALGVLLRIAWRTLVMAGTEPDRLLHTLQDVLIAERHATSVFTTLCMASIDAGHRRVTLRVAGHPLPVILAEGEAQAVPAEDGGPPLGVIADAVWPARELELPEGFGLLLYTDGLVEGRIGDGPARLGEQGLVEMAEAAVREHGGRPGALVRALVEHAEALNGGALLDDVAVLLVSEAR
jgi:serine phosphatase RsbU (regulator of sigma subunit)